MIDRPAWHDFAACKHMDKRLFFPDTGVKPREALNACRGCPVQTVCLEANLHEHHGVWGGTTELQRRAIRRERCEPTHGTLDGYDWHKRTGSDPCGPCRRANATRYYPQAGSA